MATPSDQPPSYDQAVKGGPDALPQEERNGIPLHARRSMEDELRPLPEGWVREFDPETQHQFFVDTKASPPRSIWHHPYDDDDYLASLPSQERDTIVATHSAPHRKPSSADIAAEDTDAEDDSEDASKQHEHDKTKGEKVKSLGRRLKDHLTGSTHEQRAADRERRAEAEKELYRQHRMLRQAMITAMRTGRPQSFGRDSNGTELFLEPPGHTFPGVARVKRLSPYFSEVVYEGHGGRYGRPMAPYGRVVGRGYGGGLGYPMMMPMMGGMMGGRMKKAISKIKKTISD
ncbi:hypothetical protein N658DRAFT_513314 [Parathielavia hyrcaniae]|uniref:WW domain-containing protein n=1 Tax=Parathielavia hyrcaniae TaxID=113614 RepID=A0AAN6T556_9PEZI|nr:hypothetical protein N658DRAFT_513314 [Parathielavia hyrcaniae]